MSTILVTGATGHLGSEVVRQLLDRRHSVRAYTRQSRPSISAGVQVYQGDIREGSDLDEAIKGVDAINLWCLQVDKGSCHRFVLKDLIPLSKT